MAGMDLGKLAVVALGLTLMASSAGMAEGQSKPPIQMLKQLPGAQSGSPLAIYKACGINADQEAKIKALIDGFHDLAVKQGGVMMQMMKDMRDAMLKPDPDKKACLAKQIEINKMNSDMSIERMNLAFKIRAILTPEQRQKLVQMIKDHAQPGTTMLPKTPAAALTPTSKAK